jgi:hypothetical protein
MIMENAADTFSLAASPAMLTSLPVTNLQVQEGAFVARSTSTAQQIINFDCPTARIAALDMFALMGDFSSSATVGLTLYSQAGQLGDVVYTSESEVWKAIPWESFGPWGYYEWGGGRIFDVSGSEPTAVQIPGETLGDDYSNYLSGKIVINDTNNPDGYHNLKRLFVGTIISPEFNFEWGADISTVSMTKQERSEDGGLQSFPRAAYRRLRFNLEHLSAEEFAAFWRGITAADKINDIYIQAKPAALGIEQAAFMMRGKLTRLPSFAEWAVQRYKTEIEIEETR